MKLTSLNFANILIFSIGETAGGGAGAAGQGQGGAAGGAADEQLSRDGGGEEAGPPAGTEGDHCLPSSRSQASRGERAKGLWYIRQCCGSAMSFSYPDPTFQSRIWIRILFRILHDFFFYS